MKKQLSILFAAAMLTAASCQKPEIDAVESIEAGATNPDWAEASHSNNVAPDYTTVFPQDKVNTLEITMTAQEWKTIQTDMAAKFGNAFGARANAGPGGGPPGGGGPGGGGGTTFSTEDPDYVALPVKFNGKTWTKVGFRLKGNSSLSSAWSSGIYKLPFRLNFDKFEDDYPEIKNQRMYGFQELSFSPAFNDYSLIREKAASDIFRLAGVPAAQTAFYKVYIDFGSGKQYCGVYTMVEVIDDTMVESQFGDGEGNIYKPESTFQTFVQSQFEKKNNKTEADYSDAQAFVTALNASNRSTDAATWRTNLEKVFDVDHFLKYLAVNNTIVNWDAYGAMAHNYYLYRTPTGQLTWIPWDHNESMTTTGRNAVSLSMTEVSTAWPLIRYVANDPVYYAQYKQYVKDFSENVFTTSRMNELFDRYTTLISPYVIGPNATETGKYSYLSGSASFTSALPSLKSHVANRQTAVTTFLK
jgi:spore coat protein H